MNPTTLEKTLAAPFELEQWQNILHEIFGASLFQPPLEMELPGKNELAESAFELGSLETKDERLVGLYWLKVKPQVWLKQNKVGLRSLLRTFYEKQVDGALVVFEQGDLWRFSFISEIRVRNEAGKIIDQKTAPKRFTYLLGRDQKVRTPSQRFAQLSKRFPLQALFDAFSVESLNQEFYAGVAEHFYELVGKKGNGGLLKLPGKPQVSHEKTYQDFAVRLIGRVVFCWFLKMKCSEADVPLLPASFLSSQAVGENQGYYHTVLERLFFQILNTPMEQRRKDLPQGAAHIPFLNGGLFAPHGEDFYQIDEGLGLSRHLNTLEIPDAWFVRFFEFLEQYHFTLDENSLTQAEVSVDPEMLGRIFESLLAEIDPESGESERKATGSFYTPREIVDFMVQESLMHALHENTGVSLARLLLLFQEEAALDFSPKEISQLLDALFQMKILDPACGSGAFPMGILQKMLVALEKLDPEAKGWIERQIQPIENAALKAQIQKNLDAATVDYARKIGIVQNSIYGVDLQPIATGIAQLRCFLTLIVDEKIDDAQANRSIQPLPNLEFKFVSADALGQLPKDRGQMDFSRNEQKVERLKTLRKEYLQSSGGAKEAIKNEFLETQKSMLEDLLAFAEGTDGGSVAKLMAWNPFESQAVDWFDPQWMFGVENGFDLVIGNPPYIQMQKNNGALTQRYQPVGYQTLAKTGDIYALFYERSLELLKAGGHSGLITSNKWMRTAYGQSLRHFLAQKNPLRLLDLGPGIFTATVDTNILLVQQETNQNTLQACTLQEKKQLPHLVGTPLPALPVPSEAAWIILNPQEQALKEKIEQRGTPLKQWPVEIYRGIITGYNTAFIISNEKRDELIAQDSQSAEILKPILRGRDIQRYSHQWAGLWVIVAKFGSYKTLELDYPAIYNHLKKHEEKLKARGQCRYSRNKKDSLNKDYEGQHHWLELDNNPKDTYLQAFEGEKVVWQEMAGRPCFVYDDQNMFCNDTGRILTGERVKFFAGFFNSRFFEFAFSNYYAGGGLGKKGIRYKSEFMKAFPIPAITSSNEGVVRQIEELVEQILKKKALGVSSEAEEGAIDSLVFGLYGLSEAEVRMVSGEL